VILSSFLLVAGDISGYLAKVYYRRRRFCITGSLSVATDCTAVRVIGRYVDTLGLAHEGVLLYCLP
jgi:hypothetical protein